VEDWLQYKTLSACLPQELREDAGDCLFMQQDRTPLSDSIFFFKEKFFMEAQHYQTTSMTVAQAQREASTVFLAKVFNWMAIGLGLTGLIAFFTASSGLALSIAASPLFMILLLAELGLVFFLSARIEKIQAGTATGLFLGYSVLNGLTLSTIFLAYTRASIGGTFLITAGMFGAMAVYGMVTKRDLSGMGSFLFMGLIGIILASVVNIFLKSSSLYWAISVIGVLVFVGLTAWDVQKIKTMGEQGIMEQGEGAIRKGAIIGALALYLDFINLFLMLLRFFGGSRD
jgi:FtsH-binding integral membrane protein